MIASKRLVLDANILLRGVFGVRVRSLLEAYEEAVALYSPNVCFEDARRYIPYLASRRNFDPRVGLALLDQINLMVEPVDRTLYEIYEVIARGRVASRDVEDSPVVAASLLLACPIWTEDRGSFGSRVATWTTNKIELYLRDT